MIAPGQPQGDATAPLRDAMITAGLDAGRVLAAKAAGSTSAAEAKDFAAATLALAQAVAAVDGAVDGQGTPLSHHDSLETVRAAAQLQVAETQGRFALDLERLRGENAMAVAKENARNKPAPAEKTITAKSGADGSRQYTVKG